MGKCVRIRGSSKPPAAAASCLTLRSGRRVLPPVAASKPVCSPRTSGGRPRRYRGSSALLRCGAAFVTADKQQRACAGPRRRSAAGRVLRAQHQELCHDGRPEKEDVPVSRAADTGGADTVARGVDSFGRPKTAQMTNDCDAAATKAKAKHENDSHRRGVVARQVPSPPPPPTEAEIEAFFAAAELAERRRFAEAYNYDVALDRPFEGRFDWAQVST